MQQYCDRTSTAGSNSTTAPTANRSRPSIKQLAKTYGLDKDDELDWSDAASKIQSVKQEFQAYITEPQSLESDILHYWKVCERAGSVLHLLTKVNPQL